MGYMVGALVRYDGALILLLINGLVLRRYKSRIAAGLFVLAGLFIFGDGTFFLIRAGTFDQGACRGPDSGSCIGTRMAQICVGQPRTPTYIVWEGGLVRNLPDRDQQRRRTNLWIVRPTTADSFG